MFGSTSRPRGLFKAVQKRISPKYSEVEIELRKGRPGEYAT